MEIYQGLLYPHLRQAHDRIYFGAWRGSSPSLADLKEAQRQLGCFLDGLERELQRAGGDSPGRARSAYGLRESGCLRWHDNNHVLLWPRSLLIWRGNGIFEHGT